MPTPKKRTPAPARSRTSRRAAPPKETFSYSAYYATRLSDDPALVERIEAFAARLGAEAVFEDSGRPFGGCASHVTLEPLSAEGVAAFKKEFAPKVESAITIL